MNTNLTYILPGILLLVVFPYSYAEYGDEKMEFAGYLEETLGHFWAIEQNLDNKNTELALVHATHPIAELYDSMKPELKEANPEFDAKVQQTLMDLGKKTGTGVTRQDAQKAIDEAKSIIEEARMLVVGDTLSNDIAFRAKLMQGLLETSAGEYEEGVNDGQIAMMAEFQDGSAFVWRSQQIFDEIKNDLPAHEVEEISEFYSELWEAYENKSSPIKVETLVDGIIHELDVAIGEESEETDLLDYVDNIYTLLNQVKSEYSDGNVDTALSLATKAYLDNFEFLESPVAQTDPELVDEIEKMMREELRDLIRNKAPATEINEKVDAILAKMDTVAKIVPEFGQIALLILVVGTISVIFLVSRNKNLSIVPKI